MKLENKMRNRIFLLLIIGAFVIVSCSIYREQDAEKLPGINIPVNKMNSKIVLEPDPGMPQVHKNGEPLGFLIRNRSSSMIAFDKDFGIKAFKKQGTIWEPVANNWGYPEGENLLATTTEDPTGLAIFLLPDVKGLNDPTNVRIVIVGHEKDKPAEQVGAYIDVLYNP